MASKWIILKDVPLLDEHVVKDDDGNVVVRVGVAKLRQIARNNNKRIKETGDEAPVVIGHTIDDAPETKQPPIVGFARNFVVKPFKKTGRMAIHGTLRVYRKYKDCLYKFPRRSVELWLGSWLIDPISLLGATTPERDLGLLRFSKQGKHKYRREIEMPMSNVGLEDNRPSKGNEDLLAAVKAALEESDVFKWVRSKMQEEEAASQTEGEPGMEGEEPGMGGEGMEPRGGPDEGAVEDLEDEDEGPEPGMEGEPQEGEPEEEEEEEPVRYSGGAFPSGDSTQGMPKPLNVRKSRMSTVTQGNQRVRLEPANTGSTRIKFARMEKRLRSLEKQNTDLRIQYQKASRERDLIQLEAEGVDLDREEELNDLMVLPEELYQRQLSKMRVKYRKLDGANREVEDILGHSRTQTTSGVDADAAKAIADFALKNKISYPEARSQLYGE